MKMLQLLTLLFIGIGFSAFARHPILVEDDICTITNKFLGHSRRSADTFSMLNRYQEERDILDKDFAAEIVAAVESLRQPILKKGDPASSHLDWAWEQGVRYLGEMDSVTVVATNFLLRTMRHGYMHEIRTAAWSYFRLMKFSPECFSEARNVIDGSGKLQMENRMQLIGAINRMINFSIGYGPPSPMSASNNLEYAREWIGENSLRALAMLRPLCVARPEFEYSDEWKHYARLIVNEPLISERVHGIYRDKLKQAEEMKKERERKQRETRP